MSDNIDRLLATGVQKYLNYEVRQPYKVEGHKIAQGLNDDLTGGIPKNRFQLSFL